MLYGAEFAVCSQINTKHINTVWADRITFLSFKPAGARKQQALKVFFLLYIASYNLLNIDRVISKVEVRKGCEAGTIHQWFTGALLLG